MDHILGGDLERHMLDFIIAPRCRWERPDALQAQALSCVCSRWRTHLNRIEQNCTWVPLLACPTCHLCEIHQQHLIQLWDSVWEASFRDHTNPFSVACPNLTHLQQLHKVVHHHLHFSILGGEQAREIAWVYIPPGDIASRWWHHYQRWVGVDSDDY